MEGANTLRVNSPSIWRNTGNEAFSRSSRADDEVALKWAALERLPTSIRIRRGQLREVDIKNLGSVERKNLFDRLLKTHEEEVSEKFLMKLKERIHRVDEGMLTDEEGQLREVDIKNLGSVERKNLVDRLLKTDEEEGSEKFLMKLKERIHRVGLDLPTIEVRFEQ
ncbi:hypothetical protein CASFOL_027160 [Castilleja foliolosa]|uniref:Uncharacterized protein n=1 Tax=Castilleja foliolosa TaxID=1961234 RepID=A0ABD3CFP8_9LAMI